MNEAFDILDELIRGRLTLSKAEEILERVIDSTDAGSLPAMVGMSAIEWTAFGHGAHLGDLSRWRADGWPSVCDICGKRVFVDEFGWVVRERDGTDEVGLVHVSCL